MSIRLVLADDHPIFLDGLEQLFRLEKGFEVLARCVNGEETVLAVREHRPDVLILDLQMPGKTGLEVLREMNGEGLPTRVVLLTAALNVDEVLEATRLGVRGVVLKEMAPRLLVQCVRTVHAGGQWLEKRAVGLALDRMLEREAGARELANVLTRREIEIMRLVVKGSRNKEIAEKLFISEGTVKVHLHSVYEKLQVDSRVELTLYAKDKGLL